MWHLSESAKSICFERDEDGYIHAMPVVLAIPQQGDSSLDGGKVGLPAVGATNIDSQAGSSGGSLDIRACNYLIRMDTGNWERGRTPVIWKQAAASAAGNTALWTPAGGKKFRVLGGFITVAQGSVAAALQTIKLIDAAGQSIFEVGVSAGALAALPAIIPIPVNFGGNGYLSALADNVLNITLATAFTTGYCDITVWGTEE